MLFFLYDETHFHCLFNLKLKKIIIFSFFILNNHELNLINEKFINTAICHMSFL